MENVKTIQLEDGDKKKTFIIQKMKATKLFFFTNSLLGLVSQSKEINPAVLKQLIHGKMQSGINEDVSQQEINEFATLGIFDIAFNAIKSILANLDFDKQLLILKPLVDCVTFQNGAIPTKMDLEEGSPDHMDNYISDVQTIYLLCAEVVKMNYSFFFKSATTSSN